MSFSFHHGRGRAAPTETDAEREARRAAAIARIQPPPPVPKSAPYIEAPRIEALLQAGVPIGDIATAKCAEWHRGEHRLWVAAVQAVQALVAAEERRRTIEASAMNNTYRLPELAPPPRPRSKLQPIEDLISQQVPRSQGVSITYRHWRLEPWEANLASAAFDATAEAMDTTPPGSGAGVLAEAADADRRKQLGLRDNEPLYDPLAYCGEMPKPLDTLNATMAYERQQRAEREAKQRAESEASW